MRLPTRILYLDGFTAFPCEEGLYLRLSAFTYDYGPNATSILKRSYQGYFTVRNEDIASVRALVSELQESALDDVRESQYGGSPADKARAKKRLAACTKLSAIMRSHSPGF